MLGGRYSSGMTVVVALDGLSPAPRAVLAGRPLSAGIGTTPLGRLSFCCVSTASWACFLSVGAERILSAISHHQWMMRSPFSAKRRRL